MAWVRDLMLTRKDNLMIEKRGKLSDVYMNAAQKLLGEQFPQLSESAVRSAFTD